MAGFTATTLAVTALAGLGASIGGQIMSSQAQAQQGREMAAAERVNADVARQNAQAIRQAGAFEIEKQQQENRRFVGRQRALIAGSGVRFSGSPLDLMSDTIASQEMDLAAMRYNTEIGASRSMSDASYKDYLAGTYGKVGNIASSEGLFKAGSSLLTEGANWGNKYAGAFKYKAPSLTKVG